MDDHRAVYEALLTAHTQRQAAALVTIISTQGSMPRHTGSKMLVYPDGQIIGTIGGGMMESQVIEAAQAAIERNQSDTVTYTLNSMDAGDPGICGGTATMFIEPLAIKPTLLVIGGGHVGKALCELAKWSAYRVILSDDRPDYCNAEYVPGLDDYLVCAPEDLVSKIDINSHTYVAAVTRGLPVDLKLIPGLLKTDAAYIGLIGSQRRWHITAQALREQCGLSDVDLARIHAPIGLELQAETPKEIAISIMAEITMLRRGGDGQPMKKQPGEKLVKL
ncbi:MAG: XdhC family protein [Aggregatilineales bacterium]